MPGDMGEKVDMRIIKTKYGAINIYIPFYGWITQCYEGLWSVGKFEDGPLWHETVYAALSDFDMNVFRLELWSDILRRRIDKTA